MVSPSETAAERKDEEPEQEPDGLFAAAYEEVTYRDTTDDGFESDLLDTGQPATDFELTLEADRISHRLAFLITLSRLWKKTAICSAAPGAADPDREKILAGWLRQRPIAGGWPNCWTPRTAIPSPPRAAPMNRWWNTTGAGRSRNRC
jgi:hypothetical protein